MSSNVGRTATAVIGFDARHNSEKFARLAAAAFLAKGFSVLWFGRPTHTPLVPFAVKYYGAEAGVMVTASHNPKEDNGYKVYWLNGCQIIPPHDSGIAAAIEKERAILSWHAEVRCRSLKWPKRLANHGSNSELPKLLSTSYYVANIPFAVPLANTLSIGYP